MYAFGKVPVDALPLTPTPVRMYKVVKKYVDDALRREQEMTVVKGAFRGVCCLTLRLTLTFTLI